MAVGLFDLPEEMFSKTLQNSLFEGSSVIHIYQLQVGQGLQSDPPVSWPSHWSHTQLLPREHWLPPKRQKQRKSGGGPA